MLTGDPKNSLVGAALVALVTCVGCTGPDLTDYGAGASGDAASADVPGGPGDASSSLDDVEPLDPTDGGDVDDGSVDPGDGGPAPPDGEADGLEETDTTEDVSTSEVSSDADAGDPDGSDGPDGDGDGVTDDVDNCLQVPNPNQADANGDGVGDACDLDGDGILDVDDNCMFIPNPDQADSDQDGVGDACIPDADGDGVADGVDNCMWTPNEDQADSDQDGEGDACDQDTDGDTIPDDLDLWPDDPDLPGLVTPEKVYAHTSGVLYIMDVYTYEVELVGAFTWPNDNGGHLMTDIAITGEGVFYGVTFDRLYTCHPQTVVCTNLGLLPTSFNGLTFVPAGTVDPDVDALVGIANNGTWYHLQVVGSEVEPNIIGEYGPPYTSSGDVFSIDGVGTFASVDKSGESNDFILRVDPNTGEPQSEVGILSGYSGVYGLAGWVGKVFAFDSSGTIVEIAISNGETTVIQTTNHTWWGAGVGTRL